MIKTEKLSMLFTTEEVQTKALNDVTLQVEQGEFVAIMGPSGCGKSTLLNILGTLDSPTSGSYFFEGKQVDKMTENQLTALRKGNLGFIFQSFNLIDELTVYENVELPLVYLGMKTLQRKERVNKVLEKVNLLHRANHYPQQLSGGQQQRVAIARAVVTECKLLLADEPTGNLDSVNGIEVMELLSELNRQGTTIIIVTHSQRDAKYAHRVIQLLDGQIVAENINRPLEKKTSSKKRNRMIGNYWNSAYRNLMKRKKFSFINIFGLAIGMASALLMLTYVTFEFSFDKMHTKYAHIYRVQSTFHEGEVLTDYWATSSFGYASAMKENLAGIEDYTRIATHLQPEQIVKYGELTLRENQIAYADPGFFRLFDFELLKGDKKTCLSMPRQVVITERIARKYFKDEDPIGKILIFTGTYDKVSCEVTGVMKEMPSNSHIHYNFLISYASLPQYMQEYWYKHEAYTYVLLDSPERKAEIEKEFPVMAEKYKTEEALKNKTWGVSLIPLADIHLTPQIGYETETKGNRSAMIALIFAAVAILAIAWINYINLTVARSMERAKEVGVRRVVGAFRQQLIYQFLFEALVMNLIAFILAVGLIELVLPHFNQLVGRTVTFSVWFMDYWWILLVLVFIAGIFISGYYPALALLNRKPITLLKGKFLHSKSGDRTRQVLVVVQYTASMILLCVTLIVFAQLNFMRNQSLGVKTSQTLVVKFPGHTEGQNIKLEAMKKAIARLPLVHRVTFSGAVPGEEVATFLSNRRTNDALKQNRLYEMLACDPDYADAYGLQIVAGRSFSEEYGDDVDKLVINETAVRNLGFASNDEAIGELVTVECTDAPMQIIGVVKDYHQQALSKNYTPIMLIHKDKIDWLPQRYISVVMASGNPRELVSQVQEIWNQYFADSSFDYFFLDQFFDHQYRQDEVFGAMIGSFTGLAIFISCLGLWVLVMFSCSTRTKEMGIRKVLGASRWNLFYQLVKGFFQLILIAVVIALPVAWFSMNAWLSHYAFRTDLKAWFFIVPVLLMLFISFVTVAFQTMKIIMSKPARSLRYE